MNESRRRPWFVILDGDGYEVDRYPTEKEAAIMAEECADMYGMEFRVVREYDRNDTVLYVSKPEPRIGDFDAPVLPAGQLTANQYSRLEWPCTVFWTPAYVVAWVQIVRSFEGDDAA